MNENQFWMVYIRDHDGIPAYMSGEYYELNDARLTAEGLMALPVNYERKAYILSATCYGVSYPSVVWQNCGAATEEEK